MDVGAGLHRVRGVPRPWAALCNPFGVDGRRGRSTQGARSTATLGCVVQPLRGRWTSGPVYPGCAEYRDPATVGCVVQPLRGRWTSGQVYTGCEEYRDPGLCCATPSG